MTITSKATSTKEPKWTMMMAKKVCQVVSKAVETLVTRPNKRNASSTYASRASRLRRVRPKKSWCSDLTQSCCKAK
jgi:hypothetical protein